MDRDELNERICRCLQEIGVLLDDGDRGAMQHAGLTPTHFNLLRQLDHDPEAPGRTISRLAELTLCTRGNVTRLVQRLLEAGLVQVRSDRSDQRLVRVQITALGIERMAAARHRHIDVNSARFGELGDSVAADLLDTLTGLAQQLRKHLAERSS